MTDKKEHHVVEEIDHALFEAETIVERFIFGKRLWVLLVFLAITIYLVSSAITCMSSVVVPTSSAVM